MIKLSMRHRDGKKALIFTLVLSGGAILAPLGAAADTRMTCTVTDATGRVTPGSTARATLYQTPQELLFDFFDLTFGSGQPVTYHVGSLVAANEAERTFADMNFVARVTNMGPDGISQLVILWDDVGYPVFDWPMNRQSAVVALACREAATP